MLRKTNRGITLVALVITIVILLILAGISIFSIFCGNVILVNDLHPSNDPYEIFLQLDLNVTVDNFSMIYIIP